MRLIVLLKNSVDEADSIRALLRTTTSNVTDEDGHLAIDSCDIVEGEVDVNDKHSVPDIWKAVRDFLAALSGIAKLESAAAKAIELKNIKYVLPDGQTKYLMITGRMEAYLPSFTSGRSQLERYAQLALKDERAATVLRLSARSPDWSNLYKIYEVVREDISLNELEKRGWLSAEDDEAFRASANNAQVSGDDARHARDFGGFPNCTMSLTKARHVISGMMKHWLSSRLDAATRSGPVPRP